MQTTAIGTVAKSLPQNVVILLTLLISKRYIPYTELQKIFVTKTYFPQYPLKCENVVRNILKTVEFLFFLPTFELRYYKSNQKQLTWKIEV